MQKTQMIKRFLQAESLPHSRFLQAESLPHSREQAANGIGFYVNADKKEFISVNLNTGQILSLLQGWL